ncbi:MAG: GIY-YIG nuclease family protein [Dehalococcoidales bacterium]|nr:GIY-YIG nuclease family protein [Dehalococcoidales bacterium]
MAEAEGADRAANWWVYILACADGTYYTGSTNDLARRLDRHNAGEGARYTRSRRPVRLLAAAVCPDRSAAQRMEAKVKRLPRAGKRHFVEQHRVDAVPRP